MIKEVYVSYETSKLLKEKGFSSDDCHTAYDEDKVFFWYGDYSKDRKGIVDAPTQALAMKWLREVHKLFVFVSTWLMHENNVQYYFEIREIKTSDFETLYSYTSKKLNSFEKVAEAGIKYCLENLI